MPSYIEIDSIGLEKEFYLKLYKYLHYVQLHPKENDMTFCPLYTRMICAMFGWNMPSGSEEM